MPARSKFSEVSQAEVKYSVKDYEKLTPSVWRVLAGLKGKLRGLNVFHLNSTPRGGGVAELLESQVSLERSLGIKSRWLTIQAPSRFFAITKKIHNLLQGKAGVLSEADKAFYSEVNRQLGLYLRDLLGNVKNGVVIIHDPQPLATVSALPEGFIPVSRIHVDLSAPNPQILEFLRPYLLKCAAVVLSNKDYARTMPWLPARQVKIIYPAINPFSAKNREMSRQAAEAILTQLGINCTRPILSQIARLDPWKDPIGVIQTYYLAKNKVPDLQLVLAGFAVAQDDPEAKEMLDKVKKHVRGDPDIHLFSNPKTLNGIANDDFVNALYTVSTVVIQKSLREGFGLSVTEAMWKGKAVVGGKTSGISLQIQHGKNGLLVSSPEEAGRAVVRLLKDEKLRTRLGQAAKKSVAKRFLSSRLVLDHARLYLALQKTQKPR